MTQIVEHATKTFCAGGALAQHLRVKLDSGVLVAAGSTDLEIGTMTRAAFAAGDAVAVRLRTAQGTCTMVVAAAATVTEGDPVYAAAGGKIAGSGSVLIGIALEDGAAADEVEVLRRQETSDASSAGGTTASAFVVDSDSSTPKIELAAQTAGTGNFKGTIKPPATLTANRVYTLAGDADATLANATGAQTWTGVKTLSSPPVLAQGYKSTAQAVTADDAEGAGNTILPGVTAVVMEAVTADANDFIVLPALADVPDGHAIRVIGQADSNFEVRTPAGSNEKINAQDSDGTKEYLFTKQQIHTFIKFDDTTGWVAHGVTALGAAVTPVVPD